MEAYFYLVAAEDHTCEFQKWVAAHCVAGWLFWWSGQVYICCHFGTRSRTGSFCNGTGQRRGWAPVHHKPSTQKENNINMINTRKLHLKPHIVNIYALQGHLAFTGVVEVDHVNSIVISVHPVEDPLRDVQTQAVGPQNCLMWYQNFSIGAVHPRTLDLPPLALLWVLFPVSPVHPAGKSEHVVYDCVSSDWFSVLWYSLQHVVKGITFTVLWLVTSSF